jgi:putative methyltransferase (TIGR04325 family)
MGNILKKTVIDLLPPLAWRFYQRSVKGSGYFGDYPDWQSAQQASTGYDADLILEKVKEALLKVKNGEAAYERDSVLFDQIQHSWPLMAALLWIASCRGNRLNLLDFGGSLGSSYFQNRGFLAHLPEFTWSIVEQEKFVRCGKDYFEDNRLKFFYTIDECITWQRPDAVLLSSVLPYLEKPYDLLTDITLQGFGYIIIDRTPLLDGHRDRLTVQRVPAGIYPARYPAWMLSREKVLAHIEQEYELIAEFDALAGAVDLGDTAAQDKGFIFRKKASGGNLPVPLAVMGK